MWVILPYIMIFPYITPRLRTIVLRDFHVHDTLDSAKTYNHQPDLQSYVMLFLSWKCIFIFSSERLHERDLRKSAKICGFCSRVKYFHNNSKNIPCITYIYIYSLLNGNVYRHCLGGLGFTWSEGAYFNQRNLLLGLVNFLCICIAKMWNLLRAHIYVCMHILWQKIDILFAVKKRCFLCGPWNTSFKVLHAIYTYR